LGYLAFEVGGLFVDKGPDLSPFYDYDVGATVYWRVQESYKIDGETQYVWGQYVQLKSGQFVPRSDYLRARWEVFRREQKAQDAATRAAAQTLRDALSR
jgi:hypothetical protein